MAVKKILLQRPVYINGIYCKNIPEAAKIAKRILNCNITSNDIMFALNKTCIIEGLIINENPPVPKLSPNEYETFFQNKENKTLLRYPYGEHPLDRGIGRVRP